MEGHWYPWRSCGDQAILGFGAVWKQVTRSCRCFVLLLGRVLLLKIPGFLDVAPVFFCFAARKFERSIFLSKTNASFRFKSTNMGAANGFQFFQIFLFLQANGMRQGERCASKIQEILYPT